MRSMTRWALAGFVALAALGAVAVLDVGSATAEAASNVSPFAGRWSGTWSAVEVEVNGTWDWTISDAGRLTGSVYTTTTGTGGTIVGHVDSDGNLIMIGYAPADAPSDGFNGIPFQGTAVIDGGGKLVISVTRTDKSRSLVAILERK
jgi:hypothetical protein